MDTYPEMPSATTREKYGQKYYVRKFGLQGKVLEEVLIPIPENKIIRIMKEDGNEDVVKQELIPLETSEK